MRSAGSKGLLVLFSAALAFSGCRPAPRSDPTAPRNDKAYQAAVNPEPPGKRAGPAFDSVTISNGPNRIFITRPATSSPSEESDGHFHTSMRLAPGDRLEGSNAAFRLLAFGIWLPTTPVTNPQGYATMTMHAPDGRALAPEEQTATGLGSWQTRTWVQERTLPHLQMFFGETNRPPGYIRPVALFDARTKSRITSGASYGQISKYSPGTIKVEPGLWHPAPMEMVVDVELDGKVVREVDAVPGSRHELPGGEVLFAGLWDGDANSTSTMNDGKLHRAEIGITTSSDEERISAIFLMDPPGLAAHIELLDARGKVISGHGGMTSGNVRAMGALTNAEAIRRIRFTVFTNHHRVVIPLPPLPGLPPENQNVRDLFDVRIPRAEMRDEYAFRRFIGQATQMEFKYSQTNVFPAGYFPRVFTNVTPADLLDLHRQFLGPERIFVVDRDQQEIRVEPPAWRKLWLWAKGKLRLK